MQVMPVEEVADKLPDEVVIRPEPLPEAPSEEVRRRPATSVSLVFCLCEAEEPHIHANTQLRQVLGGGPVLGGGVLRVLWAMNVSQKGAEPRRGGGESGIIIIAASRSSLGRFQTTCSFGRFLSKTKSNTMRSSVLPNAG